MPDFG
ncbi:hypothetical protein AZE42_06340 [Rhizopogon vesiculosus]|jgi:hypothetical protein